MSAGFAANQPVAAGESTSGTVTADQAPWSADAASRLIEMVIAETISSGRASTTESDDTAPSTTAPSGQLGRFLQGESWIETLSHWLGPQVPRDKSDLLRLLGRAIALVDTALSDQVNAIIHHPRFQKLEASWRGLRYVVSQLEDGRNVKVRMLSASWKDLSNDQRKAVEFDRSELFRKVYSGEFGVAGGEPFGVLIGDYEISPSVEDMATLGGIAQSAAAAFAPFIAAAAPTMFGLDEFEGLERPINLQRVFEQKEFIHWRRFREQDEDSRFVGLTMPRVLSRLPYEDLQPGNNGQPRVDGFRFHEDVDGPDRSGYLWGNAAYAFASILIHSFAESGWLADIRGVQRDTAGGGLITDLPAHSFSTDKQNLVPKSSTDVVVTDELEKSLNELGFIPLCHCKDTDYSAFYSNGSVQKPKIYDREAATINARMTGMLQYTLCVSRFAHYLKVLAREKLGMAIEADDCERLLQDWLVQYVTVDQEATTEVKSRFPLREANVNVREIPGQPGKFECVAHLWPHYELDDLTASVRLTTELATTSSG